MKAWIVRGPGRWALEDWPQPDPRRGAVVVRVHATSILTYMRQVLEGTLGYAVPSVPFVPGTNAVGTVETVGEGVYHLRPGQRVSISPHFTVDERTPDPAQILIGLTAMGRTGLGEDPVAGELQSDWPHGTFAEFTEQPVACVTPLDGLDHLSSASLIALSRFTVAHGGLRRGGLEAGETLIVTGATGAFGSASVLLGLAMGAGRIIAAGRDPERLQALADWAGPRVVPAVLTSDVPRDTAVLRDLAGGAADFAYDILGRAQSSAASLAALRALRRGGRLVMMGSCSQPLPLDYREMLSNDWAIFGQFMYPKDTPARLVSLMRQGLLDPTRLGTDGHPLADLDAAMRAAEVADSRTLTVLSLLP